MPPHPDFHREAHLPRKIDSRSVASEIFSRPTVCYIDSAHSARVDTGCRSIHMIEELNRLFAIRRVLERNALKIQERYLPNGASLRCDTC
jgi:hypothetical protein